MLHSLNPSTSPARQAGYEILFGAGTGLGIQQAFIGAQSALDEADVPYAASAVLLINAVSGATFIGVGQSIFLTEVNSIAEQLPNVNRIILDSGFALVRKILSPDELEIAIEGYNTGIQKTFLVVLVLACASILSLPLLSWKPIAPKPKSKSKSASESSDSSGEDSGSEKKETSSMKN